MRWMPQAVPSYVSLFWLHTWQRMFWLWMAFLVCLPLGRERACLADISSLSPASACLSSKQSHRCLGHKQTPISFVLLGYTSTRWPCSWFLNLQTESKTMVLEHCLKWWFPWEVLGKKFAGFLLAGEPPSEWLLCWDLKPFLVWTF